MALQQQISEDLTRAMKARERERMAALRLLVAALRNAAVEQGLGPQGGLDDATVQQVLARERKRRQEAAEAFRAAGRDDQAASEQAEADLIAGYLPEQLDDDELAGIVDEVVEETGASSVADLGTVMKPVMARVRGRADGARVSALVRARLQ